MEKEWYVVNTYSGHENKVKEKLEMKAQSMDMKDYIFRIIIPEQKEVEVKEGVTKEKVKKMFPGYIFVEMVMSDEAWYVVRNKGLGESRIDVDKELEVGSKVKIIAGAFQGMYGTVESLDLPNQKLTLNVDLFGQETSVEVETTQIELAN